MAPSTQSTGQTGIDPGVTMPGPRPQSQIPVEMSELNQEHSTEAVGAQVLGNNDIPASTLTTPPTISSLSIPTGSADVISENMGLAESSQDGEPPSNASKKLPSNTTNEPPASSLLNATTVAEVSSSQPAPRTSPESAAIDPSTNIAAPLVDADAGPVLVITLLLTSGTRHAYKIDEKYLTKRNVSVPGVTENGKKDPFSISVYTLKELILREWKDEWEQQPSSPSSIRLIFFGRLLDDKIPLKDCRFATDLANVVHMTVRPQDIVDEEDASKSKTLARDREGGERTAGCRCVIL